MLLEKYRPASVKEIVGNAKQIAEIKAWLSGWRSGALILHGPPGCGKTLCLELIAKEMGYELITSHAADGRGYKDLLASIGMASAQQSLFYSKKLIVIDEMETIDSMKAVTELIKGTRHPVVLVTSDPYDRKLAALRRSCTLVKFERIRSDSIAAFLAAIAAKEDLQIEQSAISQLARSCDGDVRSALVDLECGSAQRDREENVFETLKILFKTLNLANSRYAIDTSEKTPEDIMMWLAENVPNEYERPDEIAAAYDALSKADITMARIMRRQSWSLQKYFISHLSAVAFAKQQPYRKFVSYAFPRMASFRTHPPALEKLAKKLHVSRRQASQYIRLIKLIKSEHLLQKIGMTDEELSGLD